MARDPVIDRSIETAFDGVDVFVKALFVAEIDAQLGRVVQDASPSAYSQVIDGQKGAAIEDVQPYGVASFTFSYMAEVVRNALTIIKATSPVDSGKYQSSHLAYVDGAVIDPSDIGMVSRVVIAAVMPYSRRIEVPYKGRGGVRIPWSKQPQVPAAGVYHAAASTLNRKYGNIVLATFDWVSAAANDPDTQPAGRFPAIVLEDRISA